MLQRACLLWQSLVQALEVHYRAVGVAKYRKRKPGEFKQEGSPFLTYRYYIFATFRDWTGESNATGHELSKSDRGSPESRESIRDMIPEYILRCMSFSGESRQRIYMHNWRISTPPREKFDTLCSGMFNTDKSHQFILLEQVQYILPPSPKILRCIYIFLRVHAFGTFSCELYMYIPLVNMEGFKHVQTLYNCSIHTG